MNSGIILFLRKCKMRYERRYGRIKRAEEEQRKEREAEEERKKGERGEKLGVGVGIKRQKVWERVREVLKSRKKTADGGKN